MVLNIIGLGQLHIKNPKESHNQNIEKNAAMATILVSLIKF